MALTHVSEIADQDFTRISDGQRQRVMLARAVCQEPDVLVLDEPTSFLDIRHKLELLSLLKKLALERQIAVVMSLHELDLAQKCSDYVLCIGSGRADRYGTPGEVFQGDYIEKLYGVHAGSYDAHFGSAELMRPEGTPQVFVIGGGGSGIPVYRALQRAGIPFAAGVLSENDLDMPSARALAVEIVFEPPFEPVSEAGVQRALKVMERCAKVVCTTERFGTMNLKNKELRTSAQKQGKLIPAENLIP